MDRRLQKATVARPQGRVKRSRQKQDHVAQLLLAVSVGALLLGSIVAWKVYSDRGSWREWSMGLRSGLTGMHGDRSAKGSAEDIGKALEDKSIRYLGQGYAELGEFSIGRFDAITGTTLTVKFQLKGMTPCNDEATFNTFMHENERAFRDRVTQAVRDCESSDFTDATALGKKVVARVNRAFSGRFLGAAELVDFGVFESVSTYESEPWQSGEQAAAAGM